jgi:hypothetical protein
MTKFFTIGFTVILSIGIAGIACGGTAEKATGGVQTSYPSAASGDFVSFNAQEVVPEMCIGKGNINYSGSRDEAFVYHFDVRYVRVEPDTNEAYFAGVCNHTTNDQNLGEWMYIYVYDGTDKNTDPDRLGGFWCDSGEDQCYDAVENGVDTRTTSCVAGNLVVHP